MTIKEFYLENMFSNYTSKMPIWLRDEAEKELNLLQSLLFNNIKNGMRVLDIGCGDCRIFKLPVFDRIEPTNRQFVGYDIFEQSELPYEFTKWLTNNYIEYRPLIKKEDSYSIPIEYDYYDIITCFGVDVHLSDKEVKEYINDCILLLKKEGILVWQSIRTSTELGKRIQKSEGARAKGFRSRKFYDDLFTKIKQTNPNMQYVMVGTQMTKIIRFTK